MRRFLKKTLLFLSPIIIGFIGLLFSDAFKVYGTYEDYYDDSFITMNRGVITYRIFQKNNDQHNYNSFIFGNSRSQAFKCTDWKKYLDENAEPFHFDGSNEGLYAIHKKIKFLDEIGNNLDNALFIFDRKLLTGISAPEGHLYQLDPELDKGSKVKFHGTFIKAQLDLKFLIAYYDYKLFRTHRGYMDYIIRKSKYVDRGDSITGDLYYGYDEHIKSDSLDFYNLANSKGIFYKRPRPKSWISWVSKEEIKMLLDIREIFDKNNTDYRIVIAPIYDQIPMEDTQLQLLNEIFEPSRIFNYSGINDYTNDVSNYYESSHFRPHVARKILQEIYPIKE